MWLKATSFAALVVGSSIALLTGAQAAMLNFGPSSPNTPTVRGGQQAVNTNMPLQMGSASFGPLSGTFAFGTAASNLLPQPTLAWVQAWNRVGTTTNFSIATTALPFFTASFDGGADTVRGTVNPTSLQLVGGSADQTVINGTITLTSLGTSGSPDFLSSLPAIGVATSFSWTFTGDGVTSMSTLQTLAPGTIGPVLMSSSGFITTPGVPTAPDIPLPPAIYLFGSVLGGAFWLGRRKRTAVSSLGSA